jgi:hypothetical protein
VSRSAPIKLDELFCDAAARYLANKGRGAHLEQLSPEAWEQVEREWLTRDPRFVESPGGLWELAEVRESRHAVLTEAG